MIQIRSFSTTRIGLAPKPKHLRKKIPVALLEDVQNVGKAGDTPWVLRGMMRRNLFPEKKALYLNLQGEPIPIFDPLDVRPRRAGQADPLISNFKVNQARQLNFQATQNALAETIRQINASSKKGDFVLSFVRKTTYDEFKNTYHVDVPVTLDEITLRLKEEYGLDLPQDAPRFLPAVGVENNEIKIPGLYKYNIKLETIQGVFTILTEVTDPSMPKQRKK